VNYDLPAIFQGRVHLKAIQINLNELVVVKNKEGELNINTLTALGGDGGGKKAEPREKKEAKPLDLQIDSLDLQISRVIYKDYSSGDTPSVKEFELGINEHFENITDPNDLVKIIVVKALMGTTLAKLPDLDFSGLASSVSGQLDSAKELAGQMATQAQEELSAATAEAQDYIAAKGADAKEVMSKTTESVSEAVTALSDKTKDLTGGLKKKLGSFSLSKK